MRTRWAGGGTPDPSSAWASAGWPALPVVAPWYGVRFATAKTDAEGRYELDGVPANGFHELPLQPRHYALMAAAYVGAGGLSLFTCFKPMQRGIRALEAMG